MRRLIACMLEKFANATTVKSITSKAMIDKNNPNVTVREKSKRLRITKNK